MAGMFFPRGQIQSKKDTKVRHYNLEKEDLVGVRKKKPERGEKRGEKIRGLKTHLGPKERGCWGKVKEALSLKKFSVGSEGRSQERENQTQNNGRERILKSHGAE